MADRTVVVHFGLADVLLLERMSTGVMIYNMLKRQSFIRNSNSISSIIYHSPAPQSLTAF